MSTRVGIIIDPYEEREPSGLAYVTVQYLQGLLQRAPQYEYFVYTKKPFTLFPLPPYAHNVIVSKSFPGKNWYFLKEYFFHRERFPDLLVFNMPLLPLILPRKVHTAVYCHEVLYDSDVAGIQQYIAHALWRFLAHHTMKHARGIFTATQAILKEITKTYGIPDEKIHVIPHGIRPVPGTISSQTLLSVPYFLFAGRTKYKKNMHGIIEGFIRFKEKTSVPHVLCLAGRTKDTPYLAGLLGEVARRGFEGSVIRTGYLPEQELLSLLKGATAFVFCSLAEGFGLPIPEAMSVGVPVIASDIPVLSEVSGGAALLIDPRDPDAIAQAMESVVHDERLRDALIERGLRQAKKFNWNTAQEMFVQNISTILET